VNYLLIVPQLGVEVSGAIVPGGLLQFGRCLARALASTRQITKLGVWCQNEQPGTEDLIRRMLRVYAHPGLFVEIRVFGRSRWKLAEAVARSSIRREYDEIMYALINQAELTLFPWHPPYCVWEIGRELFEPVTWAKRRALRRAKRLLSISANTARLAAQHTAHLPAAQVVHLCVEPPLYELEPALDLEASSEYAPAERDRAILIVANMHREMLYKGHQQLIAAWSEVVANCPEAELWIAGSGSGRDDLEALRRQLSPEVAQRIVFWGRVEVDQLTQLYQRCRAFAMPSRGEGFGLVFVEAARFGLPCIGGKYDSAPEIIQHNVTGFLVDQHPHDVAVACLRLLTDDDLAQRMGQAARQRYMTLYRFGHFQARLLKTLGWGDRPA
jgi:phosphatidylinositol alpha-1,6-mannosyltransferase